MLFNSLSFLVFFPSVCIIYYIIPHRFRYIYLLACSYYFYGCWNPKYTLLMLASTIITFFSGILIDWANHSDKNEEEKEKLKKVFVALSFISNLLILFFFKYYNFAADTVVRILHRFGIDIISRTFDVILPVGISFYTFQALSYTMDVYRKDIYAEKNFFKYALFVSFFPQLVAGPIERSKNLLIQINEKHTFDFDRMRRGLVRMLYGYFQKVIIADYLARIVDTVYNTYTERTGYQLLIATVLFAFQIYCDFGSYSNIAIGAAQVMGFRLMDNFDTPYFSKSVAEFWRRWHISLSSWFKDYLYIPLGGSRKGRLRKYINIMIVFLVSGLWHGASWHYCFWGGLNGLFQIIGDLLKPINTRIKEFFHVDEGSCSHMLMKMLVTFVLVDFSWIFFRAGFIQSIAIIKTILGVGGARWLTWGTNLSELGINTHIMNVLVVSFAIMTAVDVCRYRKIDLIGILLKQGIWVRWIVYYAALFGILVYGAYGPLFDATQFIYFQF